MDICQCSGEGCPMKDSCWRYLAPVDEYQSYFMEVPIDTHGKCKYYWEVKYDSRSKSTQDN